MISYTTFTYGKARADKKRISTGEKMTLTIPVSNIGSRDGEEVVQVYLRREDDPEGPTKTLRAFKRVEITKGKSLNVKIELPLHIKPISGSNDAHPYHHHDRL